MPPMTRRSVLRFAVLLAALALLLPLAALAGSCTDCLWAASPDSAGCCPPSCCSCCAHGLSVLTIAVWGDFGPARSGLVMDLKEDGCLSMSSRDVFHVPKASLV